MDGELEERLLGTHLRLVVLAESLRGMGTVAINDGMNVYGLMPDQAVRLLGAFLSYTGREAQAIADVMESILDSPN